MGKLSSTTQTTLRPTKHSASLSSASLVLVNVNGLADIWPRVARMIKDACQYSHGALTARDVLDNLARGDWELWLSMWYGDVQACAVTHMWSNHRDKVFVLKLVAGEGWQQHFGPLRDVARRNGCTRFHAECARPGWDREMPKFGFHKAYTVWELPLDVPA